MVVMKKILIYVFLIILVIGSIYFYKDEKGKTNNAVDNNKTTNKVKEEIKCIADYECTIKDNKKYYFSNIISVNVNDMYNYVNDEAEAGILKIDDNKLEFVGLDGKVIKEFNEINDPMYIESNDKCNEKYFVVLTKDGKVYRTDLQEGLFVESAFYQVELDYVVKGISLTDGNNTCINNLTVLDSEGNIKELSN